MDLKLWLSTQFRSSRLGCVLHIFAGLDTAVLHPSVPMGFINQSLHWQTCPSFLESSKDTSSNPARQSSKDRYVLLNRKSFLPCLFSCIVPHTSCVLQDSWEDEKSRSFSWINMCRSLRLGGILMEVLGHAKLCIINQCIYLFSFFRVLVPIFLLVLNNVCEN